MGKTYSSAEVDPWFFFFWWKKGAKAPKRKLDSNPRGNEQRKHPQAPSRMQRRNHIKNPGANNTKAMFCKKHQRLG